MAGNDDTHGIRPICTGNGPNSGASPYGPGLFLIAARMPCRNRAQKGPNGLLKCCAARFHRNRIERTQVTTPVGIKAAMNMFLNSTHSQIKALSTIVQLQQPPHPALAVRPIQRAEPTLRIGDEQHGPQRGCYMLHLKTKRLIRHRIPHT